MHMGDQHVDTGQTQNNARTNSTKESIMDTRDRQFAEDQNKEGGIEEHQVWHR